MNNFKKIIVCEGKFTRGKKAGRNPGHPQDRQTAVAGKYLSFDLQKYVLYINMSQK